MMRIFKILIFLVFFHSAKANDKFTLDSIPSHKEKNALKINSNDSAKGPSCIFLDGKKISQKEMNELDPKNIESINVWKGENAIKKFGELCKLGVVEIFTKKAQK